MNYFMGTYYISDGTKPIELKVSAPIEWIPIESNEAETLLISKYVLDWDLFGFDGETDGWSDSYLKQYMDKLYDEMFIEEEKNAIIEKKHGKLFLLSVEEIEKYFPEEHDRRAQIKFVAKKDDIIETYIEHSTYWLRNDSLSDNGDAANIDALGNIDYGYVERDEIGIRPCIYVRTKHAKLLTEKAGFNPWHHYDWKLDELEREVLLEDINKKAMEELEKGVPQEELDKYTRTIDEFLDEIDNGFRD